MYRLRSSQLRSNRSSAYLTRAHTATIRLSKAEKGRSLSALSQGPPGVRRQSGGARVAIRPHVPFILVAPQNEPNELARGDVALLPSYSESRPINIARSVLLNKELGDP